MLWGKRGAAATGDCVMDRWEKAAARFSWRSKKQWPNMPQLSPVW